MTRREKLLLDAALVDTGRVGLELRKRGWDCELAAHTLPKLTVTLTIDPLSDRVPIEAEEA